MYLRTRQYNYEMKDNELVLFIQSLLEIDNYDSYQISNFRLTFGITLIYEPLKIFYMKLDDVSSLYLYIDLIQHIILFFISFVSSRSQEFKLLNETNLVKDLFECEIST